MTTAHHHVKGEKRSLPRRFYEKAEARAGAGGFSVFLDGRPLKTPSGRPLAVASEAVAQALVAEWMAQEREIDPATMHLTRLVNTALERVTVAMDDVRADIVAYAGGDMLCYRAAEPDDLAERQRALWDPPLAWASERLGVRLRLAAGIIAVDQPAELAPAFHAEIADLAPLPLSALHQATTLTGSAILALALAKGHMGPDDIWAAAHLDEDYQIARWGEDAEAKARRARRREEFDVAALVLADA